MVEPIQVLLTEDEGAIAADLCVRLAQLNCQVTAVVDNADDAIALAQSSKPDMFLMDVCIRGDVDGIEAAREIRRFSDAPILFMSVLSDLATIDRAADVGPAGYVVKPVEDNQLRASMQLALTEAERRRKLRRWSGPSPEELFQHKCDARIVSACSECHRIQTAPGEWLSFPEFFKKYAKVSVSHGYCPYCAASFVRRIPD